ncbi:MAG: hypothetical protein CMI02_10375, partial [Oceanospirillaceae bacterium]|nr:hypothetical protein [Oceanospirillaceae bacterium]
AHVHLRGVLALLFGSEDTGRYAQDERCILVVGGSDILTEYLCLHAVGRERERWIGGASTTTLLLLYQRLIFTV